MTTWHSNGFRSPFRETKLKIMDNTNKGNNLPPQGHLGGPRRRRDNQIIVPGRVPSSSDDGLEQGSSAGSAPNLVTAAVSVGAEEDMETDSPRGEMIVESELSAARQSDPSCLPIVEDEEAKEKVAEKYPQDTLNKNSGSSCSTKEADLEKMNVEIPLEKDMRAISPTDSTTFGSIMAGVMRRVKRLPEETSSNDDIPLAIRSRTFLKRNQSEELNASSSDTSVNDDEASQSEREEEWNSASSLTMPRRDSVWLRSQRNKDIEEVDKSARKKRKIGNSPKTKEMKKEEDKSMAHKQTKLTCEDKFELVNRAGNLLADNLAGLGNSSYDLMTGCDLGAYALDVLDKLEKFRLTSQAFTKGTLQGALKRSYQKMEEII